MSDASERNGRAPDARALDDDAVGRRATPGDTPPTGRGEAGPGVSRDLFEFDRLGDLLGDVCEAGGAPPASPDTRTAPPSSRRRSAVSGPERADPARRLAAAWPAAVGPEVAANARPVQFARGRLTVSVSSSAWAQTLHFMSEAIVARLNETLGDEPVERVVFRHAGWEERPRPAAAREVPVESGPEGQGLTMEQREALDRVSALELPPDLQARIVRAMEAAFVRGGPDSVR